MSLEAMALVWKYSKHKGTSLLLELALADYANDQNISWPSLGTLAKKIRMSRRHTIRTLEKLEASKEIKIIQAGDATHSNRYLITIKPHKIKGSDAGVTTDPDVTTLVTRESLGSDAGVTRVVTRESQGSDAGVTLTTNNPQLTTNESLNQPPPERKVAKDKKSVAVAVAVVDGAWCLEGLLDCGKVYKKRRESIPSDADPRVYVSNYLYALTQKGFHKPPSFWAASRLCENKKAGEPFDELAGLPPEHLAFILCWSADPYNIVMPMDDTAQFAVRWRGAWPKGVDAEKVSQAVIELGLTGFVPAAAPEPVAQEKTDLDRWLDVVAAMRSNRQVFNQLSAARFLNANGAVNIEVADDRIKSMLETSMELVQPKVSELFGEIKLSIKARE